ncbi:MAG: HAD family hydrolase [Acidobacteria bacterium]|nr:HAD family hydrolase [Acidobacteriota bacterium]
MRAAAGGRAEPLRAVTAPYRGIVFDLDDTLVDTRATREYRDRREWRKAVAAIDRTRIFDGITELLAALARREVPWAIVTTSVSYYAEAVLEHYGLHPRRLVAYHDARPPKPHPRGVLLALEALDLPASEVVGVGNAVTDQVAYRRAVVLALAAWWSPDLEGGDWDGELADPAGLLEYVAPS